MKHDKYRHWVSKNLAPTVFLFAYFSTVVLGNLLFFTPFGKANLLKDPFSVAILQFETLGSLGFWILLFMPFFVVPLIVKFVRGRMEQIVCQVVCRLPDFSKVDFVVISSICFGYVIFSLLEADVLRLFISGADAVTSVEARFKILRQTGFRAMVVLMSILPFLSLCSLISWLRSDNRFWAAATIFNTIAMSLCLTALNMKWPVIIYYAGLVLAVFVFTQRRPYLKAAIGTAILLIIYLLISVFVLRLAPTAPAPAELAPAPAAPAVLAPAPAAPAVLAPAPASPAVLAPAPIASAIGNFKESAGELQAGFLHTIEVAIHNSPMLMLAAVNRMAIIYPYYYQVFTTEGAVCGGIFAQARFAVACRPSTFIYTRIFKDDAFKGRGTSPAAVHISGYAMGGWPIALCALVCASVILALFSCIPIEGNVTVASLAITGAIVGYHFSQIPGEGPLFYDHGVFWVFCFVLLYKVFRIFIYRFRIVHVARNKLSITK